jgi:hypothetical protein
LHVVLSKQQILPPAFNPDCSDSMSSPFLARRRGRRLTKSMILRSIPSPTPVATVILPFPQVMAYTFATHRAGGLPGLAQRSAQLHSGSPPDYHRYAVAPWPSCTIVAPSKVSSAKGPVLRGCRVLRKHFEKKAFCAIVGVCKCDGNQETCYATIAFIKSHEHASC